MSMATAKVACTKCGSEILPATAERHLGKCAPCAAKKWYLPIVNSPGNILSWIVWPFLAGGILLVMFYLRLAAVVPGTKANLKRRMTKGWIPDWDTVRRVWASAPRLYIGPIGPAAECTVEFMMLECLTDRLAISSSSVADCIHERSRMLSAYCIELLRRRREYEILESLPIAASEAAISVDWQIGCFAPRHGGGAPISIDHQRFQNNRDGTRNQR
jgi:hypothetical protein